MKQHQTYNINLLGCQVKFILGLLAERDKDDIALIAKRITDQVDAQDKAGNKDGERHERRNSVL